MNSTAEAGFILMTYEIVGSLAEKLKRGRCGFMIG